MAEPRWKIGERGGPSPRGYLAATRRYHASRSRWVRAILDIAEPLGPPTPSQVVQIAARILDPSQGPQPPTVEELIGANRGAAIQAARTARAGMVSSGVPARVFETLDINGDARLIGVDLILGGVERDSLHRWASEGLGYIKDIPSENIENIDTLASRLLEAVNRGDRWEGIQAIVADELGVEERRLELIARDQVAKLNGRITEDLQGAAGITSYIWRTSRDQRVRESHRAVGGKEWTWAEGAPGVGFYDESGHPGQCGQCRCTAEAVLPSWMLAQP